MLGLSQNYNFDNINSAMEYVVLWYDVLNL